MDGWMDGIQHVIYCMRCSLHDTFCIIKLPLKEANSKHLQTPVTEYILENFKICIKIFCFFHLSNLFLLSFGSIQNKPCQVLSNVGFLAVIFSISLCVHAALWRIAMPSTNVPPWQKNTLFQFHTPLNHSERCTGMNPAVSRTRRRSTVSSVPCLMCYETYHSEMKGSSWCPLLILKCIFNLPWRSYSGMLQDYELL